MAILAGLLAACGNNQVFVSPSAPLGDATVQRIFLATDRVLDSDLGGTTARAGRLSFAQYDITIPPGHEPGRVEFSATNPNPATSFTVAGAQPIEDLSSFGRSVRRLAAGPESATDQTVIYVHGFNTSMDYAVYRHAQLAHDYRLTGPQITFSWPSIERTLGYVRDKDSMHIARDHLAELLAEVTRDGQQVLLFGHSMGTQLVVETLRQLSITGQRGVLSRIDRVVLLSPDIDLDLFEAQHERIDPVPDPFIVVISESDYALRFSARLTGQPERLGSARDIERLAALNLIVLDLSDLPNSRNHFLVATSPIVIDLVNAERDRITEIGDTGTRIVNVAELAAELGR